MFKGSFDLIGTTLASLLVTYMVVVGYEICNFPCDLAKSSDEIVKGLPRWEPLIVSHCPVTISLPCLVAIGIVVVKIKNVFNMSRDLA